MNHPPPAAGARPSVRLPSVEGASRLEGHRVEYHLAIPVELAACRGHFPDQPLVPGVVLIGWAMHFARAHFALGIFAGVPSAKFRRVVRPGDRLRLSLEWSQESLRLRYSFSAGATECARGIVQFKPDV